MKRSRFLPMLLGSLGALIVTALPLNSASVFAEGVAKGPPVQFVGVDEGGGAGPSAPQSWWTPQQRAQFGAKVALYEQMIRAGSLSASAAQSAVTPMAAPTAAQVYIYNQPQQTNYWCGPASTHNALGTYGVNVAQSTLAAEMGTDPNSGTSRSAMLRINYHESTNAYIWHGLGTPINDANTGVSDLLTLTRSDIWWGASVIYNVQTYGWDPLQNRYRYPLPPYSGYNIRHYYTAYGYYNNGEMIQVYDENNAYNNGQGFLYNYYYKDQWAAINNMPFDNQIEW